MCICLFSDWTVLAVSGVSGEGVECRMVSLVSMRLFISGVKLGLYTFLLPLGMCFLAILVIIALNCVVIVSMLFMLVVSSEANRSSVSSVNLSQFAFL